MHKRFLLTTGLSILLLGMTWVAAAQEQPKEPPYWEYEEGEHGPAEWGSLDPTFALCETGRAQSPIDVTGTASVNLSNITFNYVPATAPIINNGHTIQVNYPTDSGANSGTNSADNTIVYNETTYDLFQFHFHHPSEHTIDGQPAAMEIHFVHRARNAAGEKDPTGAIAVVGVMLVEGEEDNAAYATIFNNLPASKTEEGDTPASLELVTDDLLPKDRTFYTYNGSLTTPPCSQGVRWLLLTEPVELSHAQIEAFAAIFELNARPVQPLNNRDLLEDSQSGS